MRWGAPGLGDDLGWGDGATRDAQGRGGGPPPLGLLETEGHSGSTQGRMHIYFQIKDFENTTRT